MLRRKSSLRSSPIAEINVVPYIDVMLVLLVIFMITAPILTQGITVDLPQAISESLKTADREPIILSVNPQGAYFLNISETPEQTIEPQDLMVRVAAEIKLSEENHQALNILVKGDKGVAYGKVVEAMSLLKQAGAKEVGLLTDSLSEARS